MIQYSKQTLMIVDTTLAAAESHAKSTTIWGNYTQNYDWLWHEKPLLIPIHKETTAGVLMRDWQVAEKLRNLGIKRVLDVGSDTGHFMAVLKYHGIDAVGVDTNKECCEKIKSKGQNICYNLGIEELLSLNIDSYDCITCMNITHARWENEGLKDAFVEWAAKHFAYVLLSDVTHQDKRWLNLRKVHDFNFLPFYCSSFVVRIARFFKLEKIVSYTCIQKIYRSVLKEKQISSAK
jgi:SAM-dependent methyltransferase